MPARLPSDARDTSENGSIGSGVWHVATIGRATQASSCCPGRRVGGPSKQRAQLFPERLQIRPSSAWDPLQERGHQFRLTLGVLDETLLECPLAVSRRNSLSQHLSLAARALQLFLEILVPRNELAAESLQAVDLILVGLAKTLDEALILAPGIHELPLEFALQADQLLLVFCFHLQLLLLHAHTPNLSHHGCHGVPQNLQVCMASGAAQTAALCRTSPCLGT
mmetsp:Transcript_40607/g.103324  ORF Transcript_40607/g.103324 Transcript_40607/m.103324 type:complete len:223 (-) Transcript_40607:866-1534(-)